MKKKKNNEIANVTSKVPSSEPQVVRKGTFEQGYDKLGRPYEKKLDNTGKYSIKDERLKDGTQKRTIKKKP